MIIKDVTKNIKSGIEFIINNKTLDNNQTQYGGAFEVGGGWSIKPFVNKILSGGISEERNIVGMKFLYTGTQREYSNSLPRFGNRGTNPEHDYESYYTLQERLDQYFKINMPDRFVSLSGGEVGFEVRSLWMENGIHESELRAIMYIFMDFIKQGMHVTKINEKYDRFKRYDEKFQIKGSVDISIHDITQMVEAIFNNKDMWVTEVADIEDKLTTGLHDVELDYLFELVANMDLMVDVMRDGDEFDKIDASLTYTFFTARKRRDIGYMVISTKSLKQLNIKIQYR